jgi:hypothetical protein
MRHRLLFALFVFAPLASACDLLDQPCDPGYWRPRAMEECVPVPTFDGGMDSGTSADAGSSDAGSSDAGSADSGSSDAGSSDAGSSDAGSSDAGSSDAGSSDAGSDAGPFDAG